MNALILSAVLFAQCSDCGGRMVPVPHNPGMQPQPAPATAKVERSVDIERSYTGRFFGGKREVNIDIEKNVTKQTACAPCDLSELKKRIAALEAREPQQGPPGRDGKDGVDGKDGESADAETIERLIALIEAHDKRITNLTVRVDGFKSISDRLAALEGKKTPTIAEIAAQLPPIQFELLDTEGKVEESRNVRLGGNLGIQKTFINKKSK